jgi:hypothetical protein
MFIRKVKMVVDIPSVEMGLSVLRPKSNNDFLIFYYRNVDPKKNLVDGKK